MTIANRKENMKVKKLKFNNRMITIENYKMFKKIGGGHDGIVYEYHNQALKVLKYDSSKREQNNLMTLEKVKLFIKNNHRFKRVILPNDFLIDDNDIFSAYTMELIHKINNDLVPNFLIEVFLKSAFELKEDFYILNELHVEVKDINRGSFLFDNNFFHLCDCDKFLIHKSQAKIAPLNLRNFNFTIAKILYFEMIKIIDDKSNRKKLIKWIKTCVNDTKFLEHLEKELISYSNEPISEYTNYLIKKIIK